MQTRVQVKWLYDWIAKHPAEFYWTHPILEGVKTKREALQYLERLLEKGVDWL